MILTGRGCSALPQVGCKAQASSLRKTNLRAILEFCRNHLRWITNLNLTKDFKKARLSADQACTATQLGFRLSLPPLLDSQLQDSKWATL